MQTAMSLTGGCLCGRVRYQIDAPLHSARSCHCSSCRKAFSGAGSAYAEVMPGSFSWVDGEEDLTTYESAPGSGLCFCRHCGTTLCGTREGIVHGITLGSVDGDPGVQIETHIFVDSRAPWDHIGGNASQFPGSPPNSGKE
ncbi:MAG: GFA family protein [Pseudomonadota bacterium]|nr:GFA family protein [Pseudomonadota bacterium]